MSRSAHGPSRPLVLFCSLLLSATACSSKPKGPKWQDHRAAHTTHYHPDVNANRQAAPPESQPADSQPESDRELVDRSWRLGPVGSPVLFVNDQTVGVEDVLESIYDELNRLSETMNEYEYRDTLIRRVRTQVDMEISSILIYEEAHRQYDEKQMEQIDNEAARRIKQVVNDRFGGVQARYEAHLKTLNLTLKAMQERAKRQIVVMEYLRTRLRPLLKEPSRQELMKEYTARKADFTTPAKAEMFLIEAPIEDWLEGTRLSNATPVQLADAREKARAHLQRAREELESGVEFAAVARAYSKGLGQNQGGAIGDISPGALTRRWAKPAEVLFTLEQGALSDIIDTEEALFLVKCGRKTPPHQASFEEAQKQLADRILDEQFNQLRADYIGRLNERATVRKKAEFLQAILTAAPRPPKYRTASR